MRLPLFWGSRVLPRSGRSVHTSVGLASRTLDEMASTLVLNCHHSTLEPQTPAKEAA